MPVTKSKLYQTKNLVLEILKEDKASRNSDDRLYIKVCERIAKATKCPVTPFNVPLDRFLSEREKHGYPAFESVRRTRQKAQAECPELQACEKVQEMRSANEKEYREFANSDKRKATYRRLVRCVTTGKVYESVAQAAKANGLAISTLATHLSKGNRMKCGLRFEFASPSQDGTLCWHCANACGGCSWSGRDERGKLMYQPVEGWTAIPMDINNDRTHVEQSYMVIDCPEFVPERSGASG